MKNYYLACDNSGIIIQKSDENDVITEETLIYANSTRTVIYKTPIFANVKIPKSWNKIEKEEVVLVLGYLP